MCEFKYFANVLLIKSNFVCRMFIQSIFYIVCTSIISQVKDPRASSITVRDRE